MNPFRAHRELSLQVDALELKLGYAINRLADLEVNRRADRAQILDLEARLAKLGSVCGFWWSAGKTVSIPAEWKEKVVP